MLLRVALICALAGLGACAPTLSKPRGDAHLDALAEAEAHQHHGRYEQAAQSYASAAQAAERRVDRDEALYRQSRVYSRMGDYTRALAICDELGSAYPAARRTLRARLDAARYRLLLNQDVEKAEADLRDLVVEHPDDAAAKGALRMLVQRNVKEVDSVDQALTWVRTLSEEVEGKMIGETLMGLEADLLIAVGNREQAIEVLERQIELFPYPQGKRWDNALWQLADLALLNEDPKKAIEYLETMISVHEKSLIIGSYTRPLFSKAALRIARIYRDQLQDTKAALKAFAHVRDEFPKSTFVDDALAEEAMLRIETGDRKQGCKLLKEVVEKNDVGSARRRAEELAGQHCS